MNSKLLFICGVSFVMIEMFCVFYLQILSKYSARGAIKVDQGKEKLLEYHLRSIKEKKTILFWSLPFGLSALIDKRLPRDCGYCDVIVDRSQVNSSAAVVFHFKETRLYTMPLIRNPNQYYVYFTLESPIRVADEGHHYLDFNNIFNLTLTYRRDSDVYMPYDNMVAIIEELQHNYKHTDDVGLTELMAKKRLFAVWIVSDCNNTPGARQRIVFSDTFMQTKNGRRLHRKGACFPGNPVKHANIMEEIRPYKFYMALENSYRCRDYITEKLFTNAFRSDTVPVVWGTPKEDYKIPEHSAIFVEDFRSAEHLSDYLGYLDRNHTAYMEYFKWRSQNVTQRKDYGRRYGLCQLCRILHGINVDNLYYENHQELFPNIPLFGYSNQPRMVSNLHHWLYDQENMACFDTRLFVPNYLKAKNMH